jgi:hypothetical protein
MISESEDAPRLRTSLRGKPLRSSINSVKIKDDSNLESTSRHTLRSKAHSQKFEEPNRSSRSPVRRPLSSTPKSLVAKHLNDTDRAYLDHGNSDNFDNAKPRKVVKTTPIGSVKTTPVGSIKIQVAAIKILNSSKSASLLSDEYNATLSSRGVRSRGRSPFPSGDLLRVWG